MPSSTSELDAITARINAQNQMHNNVTNLSQEEARLDEMDRIQRQQMLEIEERNRKRYEEEQAIKKFRADQQALQEQSKSAPSEKVSVVSALFSVIRPVSDNKPKAVIKPAPGPNDKPERPHRLFGRRPKEEDEATRKRREYEEARRQGLKELAAEKKQYDLEQKRLAKEQLKQERLERQKNRHSGRVVPSEPEPQTVTKPPVAPPGAPVTEPPKPQSQSSAPVQTEEQKPEPQIPEEFMKLKTKILQNRPIDRDDLELLQDTLMKRDDIIKLAIADVTMDNLFLIDDIVMQDILANNQLECQFVYLITPDDTIYVGSGTSFREMTNIMDGLRNCFVSHHYQVSQDMIQQLRGMCIFKNIFL